MDEITALDRYLSDEHRSTSRELVRIVKQKDDLDYHRAIQGRLKVWLFMHIAMTYSLFAVLSLAWRNGSCIWRGGFQVMDSPQNF